LRDAYHFFGGTDSQRLQVANAVPPLLVRALGEALHDEGKCVAPHVRQQPAA
jgi:site-specific DNA-cytosine methylase